MANYTELSRYQSERRGFEGEGIFPFSPFEEGFITRGLLSEERFPELTSREDFRAGIQFGLLQDSESSRLLRIARQSLLPSIVQRRVSA